MVRIAASDADFGIEEAEQLSKYLKWKVRILQRQGMVFGAGREGKQDVSTWATRSQNLPRLEGALSSILSYTPSPSPPATCQHERVYVSIAFHSDQLLTLLQSGF